MNEFILNAEDKKIELYSQWTSGALYCDDAIKFLNSLPQETADIVFLDPPFNLGKKYGKSSKNADLLSEEEYQSFLIQVIDLSIEKLKQGGSLYFYHIPEWGIKVGSYIQQKLNFRHWIAISMKNGFARGNNLYPAHYSLLYFTKGKPETFTRPKIPAETCRHCGKYIKDYGGYKKYIEDGINLSDVWNDLSPVRHKSKKNRIANELPIQMLNRILDISGKEGGVLIDPFVGSGTSLISALYHKMNFLACDRESSSCEVVEERVNEALN